jgi:K+-transporting ATPase KdpF subunit
MNVITVVGVVLVLLIVGYLYTALLDPDRFS